MTLFLVSHCNTIPVVETCVRPPTSIHQTDCYNALSYILTDLHDLLMCTPNRITTQLLQPESITPRRSGGPFCAWPPFRHVTIMCMTTLLDHPPYESPSAWDLCLGSIHIGHMPREKHYHAYNAGIHVWLWQRNKCSRRESVNAGPRHILWYNIMQSTKKTSKQKFVGPPSQCDYASVIHAILYVWCNATCICYNPA